MADDDKEKAVEWDALKEPPPKRRRAEPAPLVDEEGEVSGSGHVVAPPPLEPAPKATSSSSSDSSDSSSEDATGTKRPKPPPHPATIMGQAVAPKWQKKQNKWGVVVQCLRHPGCEKYRTLGLEEEIFGPRAVEFYLGAWLLGAAYRPMEEHRPWKPKRKDVRDYMDTYGNDAD